MLNICDLLVFPAFSFRLPESVSQSSQGSSSRMNEKRENINEIRSVKKKKRTLSHCSRIEIKTVTAGVDIFLGFP